MTHLEEIGLSGMVGLDPALSDCLISLSRLKVVKLQFNSFNESSQWDRLSAAIAFLGSLEELRLFGCLAEEQIGAKQLTKMLAFSDRLKKLHVLILILVNWNP
jgi:hypothetical protein